MRVYILFSDDPIFKPKLLHDILIFNNFECCGVGEVMSPKRGGFVKKAKYNIGFWGIVPLVYLAGEHLIRKLTASCASLSPSINGVLSMEKVCLNNGIPFRKVANVNESSFLNELKKLRPDLILSFQHQIFREPVLSIPNIACINCHPALLPSYRGIKPIFWAMLNKEKFFGVTVHTMTREIDCGRILSQIRVPLNLRNTMFQNYRVAYSLSAQAIYQAINRMREIESMDELPVIPKAAEYYNEPSIFDVRRFKRSGLKVF